MSEQTKRQVFDHRSTDSIMNSLGVEDIGERIFKETKQITLGTSLTYIDTFSKEIKGKGGAVYNVCGSKVKNLTISSGWLEIISVDRENEMIEVQVNGKRIVFSVAYQVTIPWDNLKISSQSYHREVIFSFFTAMKNIFPVVKKLTLQQSGWIDNEYILRVDDYSDEDIKEGKAALYELLKSAQYAKNDAHKKAIYLTVASAVGSLYATAVHPLSNHNWLSLIWSREGGLGKTTLAKAVMNAFNADGEAILSGKATRVSLLRLIQKSVDAPIFVDELPNFLMGNNLLAQMGDLQAIISGENISKAVGSGDLIDDRSTRCNILACANLSLRERTKGLTASQAFHDRVLEVEINTPFDMSAFDAMSKLAAVKKGVLTKLIVEVKAKQFVSAVCEVKANSNLNPRGVMTSAVFEVAATIATSVAGAEFDDGLAADFVATIKHLISDAYGNTKDDSINETLTAALQILLSGKINAKGALVDDAIAYDVTKMNAPGRELALFEVKCRKVFERHGVDFDNFIAILKTNHLIDYNGSTRVWTKQKTIEGVTGRYYVIELQRISDFINSEHRLIDF